MSKVAVVYWSGSGNTQAMAEAVAEGAKKAGAEVDILTAGEFNSGRIADYTGIAFGCPAMGAEQLEESEVQPMWDDVKASLGGKRVALFGSYGWGDGEWMRSWEADAKDSGVSLCTECVLAHETPDDEAISACNDLGASVGR